MIEIIAAKFKTKPELVKILNCKTKYGGGRTKGEAFIYFDIESRKKY